MPMHDWSRVEPNLYHHFHQRWATAISDRLNAGLLPAGFSALVEQHAAGLVPDVLSVERVRKKPRPSLKGKAATATSTKPDTRMRVEAQAQALVRRASRVAVRHRMGEVVCIVEIVSPGNKAGQRSIAAFLDKTLEFLRAGVNVLVIDPFPPTARDPHGLHELIWDGLTETETPFDLPPGEPLLMASYQVGDVAAELPPVAYLEPFRVGAALRDMPAWLDADYYVDVPLEPAYQTAWENCPADMRYLVEHGRLPDE
jgi:hypothetical protein